VHVDLGGSCSRHSYARISSFNDNMQLLIEQRNYSNLSTYVFKADAALDATAAASSTSTSNSTAAPPLAPSASMSKKRSTERDNVQSKLDLAAALSHLGQGNYEKAAHAFLKIGSVKELGDWAGKVCHSPSVTSPKSFLISHAACGARRYRHLWYVMCISKLPAVGHQV